MNNYIQEANIPSSQYVDSSSRYRNSTVLYYIAQSAKYITFNTYKNHNIPTTANDKFTVVEATYEFRPDLLANVAYNDPRLWWVLLEANNIRDIFEFKAGINIRIPAQQVTF